MSEYPFNLQGPQESIWGTGTRDDIEVSHEFYLQQGVVIAEIEHHGRGDFQLSFVHSETNAKANAEANHVIKKMNRTAERLGHWLTGGRLRVIPEEHEDYFDDYLMGIWELEGKGKFTTLVIKLVKEDNIYSLRPGKYSLEAKSKNKWSCRLIQPDIGQSVDSLGAESKDDLNQDSMDAGQFILGPAKSGPRPVLAHIRHSGLGEFRAAVHSVDGTHECAIFDQKGQFIVEDQQTEIRPGKEYFLYVEADGEWNMVFTEGY